MLRLEDRSSDKAENRRDQPYETVLKPWAIFLCRIIKKFNNNTIFHKLSVHVFERKPLVFSGLRGFRD